MLADGLYSAYLVLCNALLRLPGHRLRIGVLRGLVRADVGERCAVERGVRIMARGGLRIGAGTNINGRVLLDARGGLTIGARVNIAPEAALLSADHDPQSPTFAGRARPVVVGEGVWIAYRAILLPGTEVGNGAVVAAGAVARGHVPARTIVAGNPAVAIGERDPVAQATLERYRRFLH
jgi:maltose O-acetyltransferase